MYYFIVNPASRSGSGKYVWQAVEEILEREKTEYRVFFTAYPKHAVELARDITSKDGKLTLIALGGDGTVNEVLNGIRDFSKVTFAYIPTGSSNDFARSLGLPTDTSKAVYNILHPTYFRRIDLGKASFAGQERYFAVSCGCGFDAAVCQETLSSPMKGFFNRLRLGRLTYAGIALRQLLLCRRGPLTLTLDGQKTLRFRKTYFAALMNCRYEGGGLKLCPKAKADDGFLDVCVVEGLSRLIIALMLPTAFPGWHGIFPGVHLYKARQIELACEQRTPVHTDGEPALLKTSLSVCCCPKSIAVIGPPRQEAV